MKSCAEIFGLLGERLASFGEDAASRHAIRCAMESNEWFSECDIRHALRAICCEMLDREKVEAWLQRYPTPTPQPLNVGIIMAGNIPLVGFADLQCVIASGNTPYIKPSSKDEALMRYVVELLREIEPALRIEYLDASTPLDALIATGGESANLYFRSTYKGTPSLLRGSRHSVAVLTGEEGLEELERLADDVFTYSGLGCRSVSLIFVPRGMSLALPRRAMCRAYHNNYLQTRALLTMQGRAFDDLGEAVAVRGEATFPSRLSCINIAEYDSTEEVAAWLAAHDDELQCVVSRLPLHSRTVAIGQAQQPTLTDYADECDTMAWLNTLRVGETA